MTLVLSTPADLVNAALVQIGYSNLVGELQEGSKASNLALAIYGATRDDLLRSNDDVWFAQRNVALALSKQAPAGGYVPPLVWSNTYPPLPWLFEYLWPDDCLKVRIVKQTPIFVPNPDPQPQSFSTPNDTATGKKVICCNVPNAICTYTGQVFDPTQMDAGFQQALIGALAERLAPALKDLQTAQAEAGAQQAEAATVSMEQG